VEQVHHSGFIMVEIHQTVVVQEGVERRVVEQVALSFLKEITALEQVVVEVQVQQVQV
jgi:hypothetical protein